MKHTKMYGHGGKAQALSNAMTAADDLPTRTKKKKPANRRGRGGRAMGGQMYAHGGMTHSGAQPMYGSTVADAMPVAGKN